MMRLVFTPAVIVVGANVVMVGAGPGASVETADVVKFCHLPFPTPAEAIAKAQYAYLVLGNKLEIGMEFEKETEPALVLREVPPDEGTLINGLRAVSTAESPLINALMLLNGLVSEQKGRFSCEQPPPAQILGSVA